MKGGKIIIDGRCPTPPQGTLLRPLTATELKQINKELASFDTVLGADAFALNQVEALNITSTTQPFPQAIYRYCNHTDGRTSAY